MTLDWSYCSNYDCKDTKCDRHISKAPEGELVSITDYHWTKCRERKEERIMDVQCGDNRFEVIAKAKAHLLDATNIDTSEDEMKVLDNFLFRCWQMGWLKQYEEEEPATKTKQIKYFDEEESVWKIGAVIIDSAEG